jgi:hypothetical protein
MVSMKKNDKDLKAARLSSVSHKYVEDNQLQDTPARLFRGLLKKLDMNPRKWTQLLRDYLDWVITTDDREKAKADRITRAGNIKDTYFQKPTLTFNKLLEGLSILRMKSCVITITVTDEEGNVHTVEETIGVMGSHRAKKSEDPADPKA